MAEMGESPWIADPAIVVNCKDCNAECCKHIAVPIDEPETVEDFERIKWYLSHDNVTVYKDVENDWLVEFISRCSQLNGHRCMAWGTDRYPRICGEYEMKTCVMNEEGEYWEILFKTPEDVDAYVAKHKITARSGEPVHPYPVCVCIPIDTPEEWGDYDDMKWYIAHHDVRVLEQAGKWYVHLNTCCKRVGGGANGKMLCDLRNNHIPHDGELFETWDDIEAHCRELGLLPERPTGKDALKLEEK
jgi:hypothetical protein